MSMNSPSQTPGGYEPPSPGPMTAAPGAIAPTPPRGIPKQWLAIIVVAAVLTLAIPGSLIFGVFGGHGSSLFVDRHGMPGSVPLPNGATFKLVADLSTSSGTAKAWYWAVDSPNNPTTLGNFYQSNLSSNGWTKVDGVPGDSGDYGVTGCNGNQAIYVILASSSINFTDPPGNDLHSVTAPAGGSAMRILVSSQPDTLSAYGCQ